MKTTDIGFEKFEQDFYADVTTAFIKPDRTKDTRTPYEQYKAGEEMIYVDFRDLSYFKDKEPELLTRDEYAHRYLGKPYEYYVHKNFKIKLFEY